VIWWKENKFFFWGKRRSFGVCVDARGGKRSSNVVLVLVLVTAKGAGVHSEKPSPGEVLPSTIQILGYIYIGKTKLDE